MKACCSFKREDSPNGNSASYPVEGFNNVQDDMVKIPSGHYQVGNDHNNGYPSDFEGPSINVDLESFFIDRTVVTNAQFARFVDETQYITEAEKLGTSFVFHLLLGNHYEGLPVPGLEWWLDVKDADWKHPFGDERSYQEILDHPVVHVTIYDALMYCKWAGKRLPNEIEWEIAARGIKDDCIFPWGNEELLEDGIYRSNVWQGEFPENNHAKDGYIGTAPADAFYENEYGVKQMIGNVWELCSNPARIPLQDIRVTSLAEQIKSVESGNIIEYAAKGGSFLCHPSYCNRARLGSRNGIDRMSASSNCGFRCVKD